MATNMRITDPQWPALREASRRILRLKEIKIIIPKEYHSITNEMTLGLGEKQPSRLTFPQITEGPAIAVEMLTQEEELDGIIIQISHNEPDSDILWIKGDNILWLDIWMLVKSYYLLDTQVVSDVEVLTQNKNGTNQIRELLQEILFPANHDNSKKKLSLLTRY
jgi:hypothetical protein